MAGILEYSTTPSSNTTINGIGISGSSSIKYGDDAIRQFMADVRSAVTKSSDKAAGTHMATKADHNQLWRVTGTATINLTSAATLTAGWALWVMADGGVVTIDPAGSEKINGAATLQLVDGSAALIICTATAFRAVIFNAPFDTGTLGQAAFLDVGTTAGTVAAGDDARIADALQKSGGTMNGGVVGPAAANDGTKSGGTYTPDPTGNNWRKIINNGAFALSAPSVPGCYNMTIDITNGTSAGAITFSGFSPGHPRGDTLTTTDGQKFKLHAAKSDIGVTAFIEALQ